jgi:hypothetical protein
MKICESCGSVIAMDVAFCPKCGAPAPIVPQSPAVQNPAAQNMSVAQDSTAAKSNENNLYEAAGQSQGASAQGSEPEE